MQVFPLSGSDPVRIGVLGCADIARRRTLPAFAADPGSRVVAVASRDGARAREVADRYGCAAVTGYDRLLADPEVEAVYVPLPVALHAPWIERALLAGKHVLGEKPLTGEAGSTRRLFELAAARDLVLAENFMFPHHHLHQRVRDLLADGTIGELRSFTGEFAIPAPPPGDIRYDADLGGGALLDIAVHPLLAARSFLGPALTVCGARLRRHPVHGVDTGGAVLLAAPDGVTAQVVFGMEHAYRSAYELWGSAGRIRVERAYAPPADHRPVIHLERPDSSEDLVLQPDDQYLAAVRAFSHAVRHEPRAADGARVPDRPRDRHGPRAERGLRERHQERALAVARLVAGVRAADEAASSAAQHPVPSWEIREGPYELRSHRQTALRAHREIP
ncbi:Gfo/Idh/MocA family protein [Streptomyces tricolor]|uniref:Gfo/Idh/MocA family protein n=1 Tax=Streptomyces tricolor TaxID=68277 RepID=UPI003813F1C6